MDGYVAIYMPFNFEYPLAISGKAYKIFSNLESIIILIIINTNEIVVHSKDLHFELN